MYCKYGDKGSLNVETLQRKLRRLGYNVTVDRSYGDQTATALKAVVGGGDGKNYGPLEIEVMDYTYAKKFGSGPGPQGVPGPEGPQGPQGEPGRDGESATWPAQVTITGTADLATTSGSSSSFSIVTAQGGSGGGH